MGKLSNHQKLMGTPWKTRPEKIRCNGKTEQTGTCTHVGTTISLIDESIHAIHSRVGSYLGVLQNVSHGRYRAQRHPSVPTKAMCAT